MRYIDLVEYKNTKTKMDYYLRMNLSKSDNMKIAKQYGKDFWDGDRKYGYGGYHYDGRWKPVAERIIKEYNLKNYDSILDFGCGKGYLLYELKKINPTFSICGIDISSYAIKSSPLYKSLENEVGSQLITGGIEVLNNFLNNAFTLVLSLGTLHNLPIYDLKKAIKEIERIGKNKYITMESFRNDEERTNLFCWALTAESYFSDKEWAWLLKEFGYTGDYSLFYFE